MIVVVPVDPPREGIALSSLVETAPLSDVEAALLYEAAVTDVLRAAAASGGELLVNYRDEDVLPEAFVDADRDAESEVRALADAALEPMADADIGGDGDSAVRFERQVGSTRSARVGNTVAHLLEREDATSVGVLDPTAPLVERSDLDGAAMSLRRNDTVVGASSGGRTYLAAFTEPIDFTDAYETPELATLARRSEDAGLKVGFAPRIPSVATEAGLCETIAMIEARRVTDRPAASATAAVIDELGLAVGDDGSLERT